MQTLQTSSKPLFTGDYRSSLPRAEAGFPGLCSDTTASSVRSSSLSVVSARENVAWCAFDVNCTDVSPSRPVPPLPCCSTSDASCISTLDVEEKRERRSGKEMEREIEVRVGEEVNDINDITALSNLSDEIEKVEARLAAIRMEEAVLCSSQRNALQGSSVSRTVNSMTHNSTKSITTAHPPERKGRESYTGLRNYLNRTSLTEETAYNSSLMPSMTAKERLCEPTPTVVSVVPETSDIVFSLATFLQPIRTVDIEVAPGVYEKLQIFADDDMEDVAKRFITKHNLNEQRALKPLYTFLVSLLSKEKEKEEENKKKKSEEEIRACSSEVSYPVENTNITAPTCSMGRVNNVQSDITEKSHKSSISNVNIPRDKGLEDYSINPKKKQQQQQQQQQHHQNQPIRDIAKENIQNFSPTVNTKPAVKSMLNCSGVKDKSRFSCKSNEGSVHRHSNERNEPKQDGRRSTPLGRSNSPHFIPRNSSSSSNSGNSNSKAHEYRYVDPHTTVRNIERTKPERSSLLHSSQPPDVVAVEVQRNRENVQKRSTSTEKREKITYGSRRPSRCSSVEGRRTMNSARPIQSIYDMEEPLPTFKPTLAPRSEKLVAQDPQRCQTPTYVRLHAQTMKRMSEQNKPTTTTTSTTITTKPSSTSRVGVKVKDDYSGKPRILSRSQEKVSQEPVGNRLYEQAIEQQRRLEEKRLKEQQKREEEEWRSILAVPQINKEKKRRSCDMNKDPTNSMHLHNASVPSRSQLLLLQQQQRHNTIKEKVKPHEERELEACTFAPAVNPASLRMFNMVVRGQITEAAGMMSSREASGSNNNNNDEDNDNDINNNKHREILSVEERLLLQEEHRRKRLEDERHFREKFDAATGRPLFRPFLGR